MVCFVRRTSIELSYSTPGRVHRFSGRTRTRSAAEHARTVQYFGNDLGILLLTNWANPSPARAFSRTPSVARAARSACPEAGCADFPLSHAKQRRSGHHHREQPGRGDRHRGQSRNHGERRRLPWSTAPGRTARRRPDRRVCAVHRHRDVAVRAEVSGDPGSRAMERTSSGSLILDAGRAGRYPRRHHRRRPRAPMNFSWPVGLYPRDRLTEG